jgi:hypothetical protein
MDPQVFARLLSGELGPVQKLLFASGDAKDIGDSIVARHNPQRAPQYYAVELWPGLDSVQIEQFEYAVSLRIPASYKSILSQIGGAKLGTLVIYGVPLSRQREPRVLDRRRRQPLDLGLANSDWRHEFLGCSSLFHLGSINWSHDDIAGVFLRDSGELIAVLRNGKTVQTFGGYEALFDYGISSLNAA